MVCVKCRHIKADGCKCNSPALKDRPYCYFHMQMHRTKHVQKDVIDAEMKLPPIEDCSSIRVALTQVLQELGAKRLDPRRAGQLLYGIQIANKALERYMYINEDELAPSLTVDPEGEEMGPEEFDCDDEDDCNDCPYSDRCPRCIDSDEDEDEDDDAIEDEDEVEDEDADEDEVSNEEEEDGTTGASDNNSKNEE